MKKYKLAFSTLGCPHWDFGRILSEALRMGYGSVELRGIGENLRLDSIPELKPENRQRTEAALKQAGISVCALDSSAAFADESGFESSLSEGMYAADAASELGIPYIRVFGDRIEGDERGCVKRVSDGISRLCSYSGGSVAVLLETHGDFNNIPAISKISELVADRSFGILWDVEHTHKAGTAPEKFIAEFLPLIRHVHLKDMDETGKLCLPGDGILHPREIAEMLVSAGYDGIFSLEWEKRWQPALAEPERAFERYAALMK